MSRSRNGRKGSRGKHGGHQRKHCDICMSLIRRDIRSGRRKKQERPRWRLVADGT